MSAERRVWHVWPARDWPFLPEEEHVFVADLQTAVTDGDVAEERFHITAVLNALRCGVPAGELLQLLPGVSARDLLGAYVTLERRRVKACHAWDAICARPTWESVTVNSEAASTLLPVPVARISAALANGLAPARVAAVVAEQCATIARRCEVIAAIEAKMAAPTTPDAARVRLGVSLHHPRATGLWSDPYYLPNRVTALSPTRVADLLQERAR